MNPFQTQLSHLRLEAIERCFSSLKAKIHSRLDEYLSAKRASWLSSLKCWWYGTYNFALDPDDKLFAKDKDEGALSSYKALRFLANTYLSLDIFNRELQACTRINQDPLMAKTLLVLKQDYQEAKAYLKILLAPKFLKKVEQHLEAHLQLCHADLEPKAKKLYGQALHLRLQKLLTPKSYQALIQALEKQALKPFQLYLDNCDSFNFIFIAPELKLKSDQAVQTTLKICQSFDTKPALMQATPKMDYLKIPPRTLKFRRVAQAQPKTLPTIDSFAKQFSP